MQVVLWLLFTPVSFADVAPVDAGGVRTPTKVSLELFVGFRG